MPIAIKYQCVYCNEETMWVYEEGGLFADRMQGCAGVGCTNAHRLEAVDIDEKEAQNLKSAYSPAIGSMDETEEGFDDER